MKLTKYFIIALFLLAISAQAQETKTASTIKLAKKEYTALRYADVIQILTKMKPAEQNNEAVQEMLAESYRKVKDYKNALVWYNKLSEQGNLKSQSALRYAEVLANNQLYKESENWYKKYLQTVGTDKRAQNLAKAYNSVESFMKNKKRWVIDYTNINTSASEYAPMFYNKGLVFVSNRRNAGLSTHIYGWDQSPFSDLYYVDSLSKIKLINPDSLASLANKGDKKTVYKVNSDDTKETSNDSRVFSDKLSLTRDTLGHLIGADKLAKPLMGLVNTKYHEGPIAALPDGSIIFTRNNYFKGKAGESKEGINKLKLFTAKAPALDQITPFPYNSNEYSTAHPTVNKAGTLLVFASDMPGGFGGVDLYYSKRNSVKEQWQKPVNMGSQINTEGDEVFPTFAADTTLFFSSTGLPGLGGLDIFEVLVDGVKPKSVPVNLGAPVNTSFDDFSLVRNPNGYSGYFSSNRRGNDDIYGFEFKDFKILLKGTVVDRITQQPLPNTKINLIQDGLKVPVYTDAQGKFEKILPHEKELQLMVDNPGYALYIQSLSTKGIDTDTIINNDIKLSPLENIAQNKPSNDCDKKRAMLNQFKIYYDFDKSNVRSNAVATMNSLSAFLKENPMLEVAAASFCDSRGTKGYNIGLSLKRSQSAKKHLTAKGIDAKRIKIFYYGEDRPVNKCKDGVDCDEKEMQLNRRTDFMIMYKGRNLLDIDCKDWPIK